MRDNASQGQPTREPISWVHQARARVLQTLLSRYVRGGMRETRILDVSCGSGWTTNVLAHHGRVTRIEPARPDFHRPHERDALRDVPRGGLQDLPGLVPEEHFHLATLLRVLSRKDVPDPLEALELVHSRLQAGGWLIWEDPVYAALARPRDVEIARRFRPRGMRALLRQSGFEPVFGSHLQAWAYPLTLAQSLADRARSWWAPKPASLPPTTHFRDGSEHVDQGSGLQAWQSFLAWLTYAEWYAGLRGFKIPLGVSYLVLARKPMRNTIPFVRRIPRPQWAPLLRGWGQRMRAAG